MAQVKPKQSKQGKQTPAAKKVIITRKPLSPLPSPLSV